ncbi:MAG: magnesium transporter [Candidatus Saliniplasma sp.]
MRYKWKRIFKESVGVLILMAFIGILGGQVLHSIEEVLLQFPIFLFLVPLMNGLGGNLGCILASRVSSGFHSGYIDPDIFDNELNENMLVTLMMGFILFTSLALTVAATSSLLPLGPTAFNLILIIFGSGMIITFGTMFITITISLISYKKRLDPDNIVIPILTTLADLLSIISIFFMVWLVII